VIGAEPSHFGLRISDCGLGEAAADGREQNTDGQDGRSAEWGAWRSRRWTRMDADDVGAGRRPGPFRRRAVELDPVRRALPVPTGVQLLSNGLRVRDGVFPHSIRLEAVRRSGRTRTEDISSCPSCIRHRKSGRPLLLQNTRHFSNQVFGSQYWSNGSQPVDLLAPIASRRAV